MSILDKIIRHKEQEINTVKRRIPLANLLSQISKLNPCRSLRTKMNAAKSFHFICEIKKASPSRGIIQPDFDPSARAKKYLEADADAISILTDEKYFSGSINHLKEVRNYVQLPILRKDFIIDSYQIYKSRYFGADLILLIARILSHKQVSEFSGLAAELGMEVLLELADEQDIGKIPDLTGHIILGINNRNLHNFDVNLETSLNLIPLLPDTIPVISESGISRAEDCALLFKHGFSGALIGEILMQAKSPKALLDKFRREIDAIC